MLYVTRNSNQTNRSNSWKPAEALQMTTAWSAESFQTQVRLSLFFLTLIKILTNGGEKLQLYFD